MSFRVELSRDANADLNRLADYIAQHHSIEQAAYVIAQLEAVAAKLSAFPERGAHPAELLALGIREYRQVLFKPYRVVYRVIRKRVVVLLIADSRRDLVTLLAERLL
jgi:toxin ParE1/3/4